MKTRNMRRLWWVVPAAMLLVVLAIWTVDRMALRASDPVYDGAPLSSHLFTLYSPYPRLRTSGVITTQDWKRMVADESKRRVSRRALGTPVRHSPGVPFVNSSSSESRVGKEAIPLITNWLDAGPPRGWRLALGNRLERFVKVPRLTMDRRALAWIFLSEYPLPLEDSDLAMFMRGLTNSSPQIRQLASQALNTQLAAGMRVDREHAMRRLYPLSSYASETAFREPRYASAYPVIYDTRPVPERIRNIIDSLDPKREFLPLLVLEMGPDADRAGAAFELGESPRFGERAVPLLIANLSSTNRAVVERCAKALGAYGSKARTAEPTLQTLLDHPSRRVRVAASNAVLAIRAGN